MDIMAKNIPGNVSAMGREYSVIHGATNEISQLISRTARGSIDRFINLRIRMKLSVLSTVRRSSYRTSLFLSA